MIDLFGCVEKNEIQSALGLLGNMLKKTICLDDTEIDVLSNYMGNFNLKDASDIAEILRVMAIEDDPEKALTILYEEDALTDELEFEYFNDIHTCLHRIMAPYVNWNNTPCDNTPKAAERPLVFIYMEPRTVGKMDSGKFNQIGTWLDELTVRYRDRYEFMIPYYLRNGEGVLYLCADDGHFRSDYELYNADTVRRYSPQGKISPSLAQEGLLSGVSKTDGRRVMILSLCGDRELDNAEYHQHTKDYRTDIAMVRRYLNNYGISYKMDDTFHMLAHMEHWAMVIDDTKVDLIKKALNNIVRRFQICDRKDADTDWTAYSSDSGCVDVE